MRFPCIAILVQMNLFFLLNGIGKVTLGGQERVVRAGTSVFIPRGTWIGVENIGKQTLSLVGVLSAPGYEDYFRAISVLKGQKATPLSPTELDQVRRLHSHGAIYR